MENTYPSFETERLFLRPTAEADAPMILALLNTPKWHLYIGDRNVNTLEDAVLYIQKKMRPQLERLGYSNYTLIRKVDQVKVGSCGLYDREGLEGIDIGFALLPDFEKKGYAFEAANCLKEAAFTVFGITALRGITVKENLSSQKLLSKLGLVHTEDINLPNDEEELMLFELKPKQ
ncbi:MAG: GNAT family N-acetyltransferase [Bacteroidota bacterium]